MKEYPVRLCNRPVPGNTLRGHLTISAESISFKMTWGQWYKAINVDVACRDVVEAFPCKHFWLFPAVAIRLANGKTHKFLSPIERDTILTEVRNVMGK